MGDVFRTLVRGAFSIASAVYAVQLIAVLWLVSLAANFATGNWTALPFPSFHLMMMSLGLLLGVGLGLGQNLRNENWTLSIAVAAAAASIMSILFIVALSALSRMAQNFATPGKLAEIFAVMTAIFAFLVLCHKLDDILRALWARLFDGMK